MPTPVVSRRSLTIAAVIVAIVGYPLPVRATAAQRYRLAAVVHHQE
jgi:hypothetical protein